MKAVWKKGTFVPALRIEGPVQPVTAWIYGDLAVHRASNSFCQPSTDTEFNISHIPSGYKCGDRPLLREAKECAEQLVAYCEHHHFTLKQRKKMEQHRLPLRAIALGH